jgi:predicted enzyme related to lactoylglutathione lyase
VKEEIAMNDMKFEIVVIPVSDVDRAKEFYGRLGWRLDAEFASGDDVRVIQFTPPGSGCSIIFGKNVTAAAPGSAQGLYFASANDLAAAFRRAEAAHGKYEARLGAGRDANWPEWYAAYMVAEQAGTELPS